MADVVNCDICGKLFNPRYVASHKRLSHGAKTARKSRARPQSAQQAARKIIAIYKKLSLEQRKRLIEELQKLPD